MARIFLLILAGSSLAKAAPAVEQGMQDALLDHLVGNWVMVGTIMGQQVTHDVKAEWVLGHQFLRFEEISRGKTKDGQPDYEATVFIVWIPKLQRYECVWLDTYGGTFPLVAGHGKRKGNDLSMIFDYGDNKLHNTFSYSPKEDGWKWRLDSEAKGKSTPFARLELSRAN